MADFPESKQKRLMSLNQDVLAVSPASSAEKSTPTARQPATGAHRAVQPSLQPSQGARSGNTLLVGLGLLACVGVVVGVLGIMFALDSKQQVASLKASLQRPDAQVSSLSARVAELEGRLDAAGQDTDKMDDEAQSNLLQMNSRIRKTALDLTRLSSDVGRLEGRVNGADSGLEAVKASLAEQTAQLKALQGKLAGLQTGAGSSAGADTAALEKQLAQLNVRLDKQASEIKAMYRMLEAR